MTSQVKAAAIVNDQNFPALNDKEAKRRSGQPQGGTVEKTANQSNKIVPMPEEVSYDTHLTSQIEVLKKECQSKTEAYDKLFAENESMKTEHDKLKEVNKKILEDKKTKEKPETAKVKELSERIEALQKETLKTQESLKNEIEALQQEKIKSETAQKAELAQQKAKIAELELQLEQIYVGAEKPTTKDLQTAIANTAKTIEDFNALTSKVYTLRNDLRELKGTLSTVQSIGPDAFQQKLEPLYNQYKEYLKSANEQAINVLDALDQLKGLNENGKRNKISSDDNKTFSMQLSLPLKRIEGDQDSYTRTYQNLVQKELGFKTNFDKLKSHFNDLVFEGTVLKAFMDTGYLAYLQNAFLAEKVSADWQKQYPEVEKKSQVADAKLTDTEKLLLKFGAPLKSPVFEKKKPEEKK
jgi:chromosome segregation ATPase